MRKVESSHVRSLGNKIDSRDIYYSLTLVAAAFTLVIAGLLAIDPRMNGFERTWLKPFKFSISFIILFGTLWLLARQLSDGYRCGRIARLAAIGSALAFFFEMTYMIAQAARIEASHFNESTPFHAQMYFLMGVGAIVLVLSIVASGGLALFDKSARFQPGTRLSVVLGSFISTVLTGWVGFELGANGGRYIGGLPSETAMLPFLRWSTDIGDLRPAHFLSLHAFQFIPICGWMCSGHKHEILLIWLVGFSYSILTVAILLQALDGRPMITI